MARTYQRYSKRRQRSLLAILKFPLFVLGVLGACSVFYVVIANPPERKRAAAPTPTPVTLSENDPVLGAADAPVRFFIYCDLAGPECAKFHNDVEPKLREEFIDAGKVALVFRNTPQARLPAAMPAAFAAMCAHGQGKFWEFYSHLLENQMDWRGLSTQRKGGQLSPIEQKFSEYAQQIGAEAAAFDTCMQDKEVEQAIKDDIEAAKQANANNAYAFRVNQRPAFAGFRDYDFVKDVISSELR